jgi:integrase
MPTTLTDALIRSLSTPGRYTDAAAAGLNLQVKPNGGKYWTLRYVYGGKRQDISLGAYPTVTLKEARARATDLRSQINKGVEPNAGWRAAREVQEKTIQVVLFANYAAQCIAAKRPEWRNPKHAAQWTSTIERFANPVIGNMPIDTISMEDILRILNPIWHNRTVTADRLRGRLEWIFSSAIARGLRTRSNPAAWRGLLETILPRPGKIKREQHHAALAYKDLPTFMKALREMDGITPLALEFLILNACRTGEVIGGRWSEVSEGGIWTIPGSRMKAGKSHAVPLGTRSMQLLEIARSEDPNSDFLFSIQGAPMSNMAMLMLLRRMRLPVTVHGFRSCFRDWVSEETDHSPEVAEKALAHSIPNKVEAAYRRGDLLEPRRRLMADWESYCLTGTWGNVIELTRPRVA